MNPEEESPLKQIRTFQGDIAEALHKQQESLVSIQRAEQLKTGGLTSVSNKAPVSSKTRRESLLLVLGSLLLLVLGSAGAWYAYNEFINKTSTPITSTPGGQFFSVNSEIDIDISSASRENIVNLLSGASQNIPDGEIVHLILRKVTGEGKKDLLSSKEFMDTLETRAPGSLVRAFDPLFMFGISGKGSGLDRASAFLIIKLASFENAFAGMLLWEKTMAEDIGPLFTTAPLLKNILPGTVFTDLTDRNKDIRVLSFEGEDVLMYSFYDNDRLIITDSIETLRVIIDRLTREKLSR